MTNFIDEIKINTFLSNAKNEKLDSKHVREILAKALEFKGLNLEDVATLISVSDAELLQEIFDAAKRVKDEIYGKRLVIFAPLYISNVCSNECLYCAFRVLNKELKRCSLTQNEIASETRFLIDQGQKRILLLAGESQSERALQYVLDSIETIYSVNGKHGNIRRINVEIAPLTFDEFKLLKSANIGTYIVFQETYHRETYQKVHLFGKKADYDWRLSAMDRAIEAGIDDVGIGALFGLADWKFELLAMLQHAEHLNAKFGIGPHTISIPRLEPACGSELASAPPHVVSDEDFCKIIAILRLAVPYTGIILSTRESAIFRQRAFDLGVSQISAGSRTNPGGYSESGIHEDASQFSLGDHRSLDEVVYDIVQHGYLPSFCTACYRSQRTGEIFMALAKSGKIKNMCQPNALITFQEYLTHYASDKTRKLGEEFIEKELESLSEQQKSRILPLINKVKEEEVDVFI